MHHTRRRRAARVAATAAALLTALATTPADPARATPRPAADQLFLTVSGSDNTWIRGVRLSCPENPGHHPAGADACAALDRADGDLDSLARTPRNCTREYDPVTAAARGTWQGRAVDWVKTYPNACTLEAETGAVFRF